MALASQIAESLAATLNSNPNVRIAAELRLAEYFTDPGPSYYYLSSILSPDRMSRRGQRAAWHCHNSSMLKMQTFRCDR